MKIAYLIPAMRICTVKNVTFMSRRTYKHFGHERESIPGVTTLWHGFLTFTFIGMGLNWEKFGKWIFGEDFNSKDAFHLEGQEQDSESKTS